MIMVVGRGLRSFRGCCGPLVEKLFCELHHALRSQLGSGKSVSQSVPSFHLLLSPEFCDFKHSHAILS